jgi:hypothetical protein
MTHTSDTEIMLDTDYYVAMNKVMMMTVKYL